MTQTFLSPSGGPGPDDDEARAGQIQTEVQSIDDLLDEVDAVLNTDAETLVNSFVQKGGQ